MAKVLIVDDEPMYRENLEEVISDEGHDVETADNGRNAIATCKRFCPDVLIVDWMLQNALSGMDVAGSLRVSNPRLTTIIITGYPSQELRVQAEKSGVFAFLEKPFGLDGIREIVRRATKSGTRKE